MKELGVILSKLGAIGFLLTIPEMIFNANTITLLLGLVLGIISYVGYRLVRGSLTH